MGKEPRFCWKGFWFVFRVLDSKTLWSLSWPVLIWSLWKTLAQALLIQYQAKAFRCMGGQKLLPELLHAAPQPPPPHPLPHRQSCLDQSDHHQTKAAKSKADCVLGLWLRKFHLLPPSRRAAPRFWLPREEASASFSSSSNDFLVPSAEEL